MSLAPQEHGCLIRRVAVAANYVYAVQMVVLRAAALLICAAAISCGPPAIEGGFDSANPAAKIYAIEQAAADNDRSAIKNIIEQLDSHDPAVRMIAIAALRRMTGRDCGYHDYDPADQRRQAIERWKAALESGELSADNLPMIEPQASPETADHG